MGDKIDPTIEVLREIPTRLINNLGTPSNSYFSAGLGILVWDNSNALFVVERIIVSTGAKLLIRMLCQDPNLVEEFKRILSDLQVEIDFITDESGHGTIAVMTRAERQGPSVLNHVESISEKTQEVLSLGLDVYRNGVELLEHRMRVENSFVLLNAKVEDFNAQIHSLLVQRGLREAASNEDERVWYGVKDMTDHKNEQLYWSRCLLTGQAICSSEGTSFPGGCYHRECNKQDNERVRWVKSIYDALAPNTSRPGKHPKSAKTHFTTNGVLTVCKSEKGRKITQSKSEVNCTLCKRVIDSQLR